MPETAILGVGMPDRFQTLSEKVGVLCIVGELWDLDQGKPCKSSQWMLYAPGSNVIMDVSKRGKEYKVEFWASEIVPGTSERNSVSKYSMQKMESGEPEEFQAALAKELIKDYTNLPKRADGSAPYLLKMMTAAVALVAQFRPHLRVDENIHLSPISLAAGGLGLTIETFLPKEDHPLREAYLMTNPQLMGGGLKDPDPRLPIAEATIYFKSPIRGRGAAPDYTDYYTDYYTDHYAGYVSGHEDVEIGRHKAIGKTLKPEEVLEQYRALHAAGVGKLMGFAKEIQQKQAALHGRAEPETMHTNLDLV